MLRLKQTYRCDDFKVLQVCSLRGRHLFSNEVSFLSWEPLWIASTLGFPLLLWKKKLQIINHKESCKPVTLACGYAVTHPWMFLSPEAIKATLPCKHKRTRTFCGFLRDFFFCQDDFYCFGVLMFLSVYFWRWASCYEAHEEILCRLNDRLNQVSNPTKRQKFVSDYLKFHHQDGNPQEKYFWKNSNL